MKSAHTFFRLALVLSFLGFLGAGVVHSGHLSDAQGCEYCHVVSQLLPGPGFFATLVPAEPAWAELPLQSHPLDQWLSQEPARGPPASSR